MAGELVVRGFNKDQIGLVKRTYAVGATDDELRLYLYQCKRTGLDPLSGQLYFIKRGGKMVLQTGIDGLRSIAEQSGDYAGNEDAKFEIEANTGLPISATVTVYKMVGGERVPFTATARWKEYLPAAPNDFMWKKMPFGQLGKCAEALALRKAFPKKLGKLYAEEEMAQGRPEEPIAEPKAIEPEAKEPEKETAEKTDKEKPSDTQPPEAEKGQGDPIPATEQAPEKRKPGRPKSEGLETVIKGQCKTCRLADIYIGEQSNLCSNCKRLLRKE